MPNRVCRIASSPRQRLALLAIRGGEPRFLGSLVFIGPGAWVEQPRPANRGRVDTKMVDSQAWGRPMKVNVYLPPGFRKGRSLPVLSLLNGGGMDADQWFKTGRVERYTDNLIATKRIRPFAIVMPSSGDAPYTSASEVHIAHEQPLWLQRTHGIKTSRRHTAVAGMSMGGFGAFKLALDHPSLYGFTRAYPVVTDTRYR